MLSSFPNYNPWTTGLFAYSLTSKCMQIYQRCWQMVELQGKPIWASHPTIDVTVIPRWYFEEESSSAAAFNTGAQYICSVYGEKWILISLHNGWLHKLPLEELSQKCDDKNVTLNSPFNPEELNSICCSKDNASDVSTVIALRKDIYLSPVS